MHAICILNDVTMLVSYICYVYVLIHLLFKLP